MLPTANPTSSLPMISIATCAAWRLLQSTPPEVVLALTAVIKMPPSTPNPQPKAMALRLPHRSLVIPTLALPNHAAQATLARTESDLSA